MDITNYQQLLDEASELAGRIDKMKAFIYHEKFNPIQKEELIRLIQQLGYMSSYLRVLKERIFDFE